MHTPSKEYNTLTTDEISIAKEPVTAAEQRSVDFNASIPRGWSAGLLHFLQHTIINRLSWFTLLYRGRGKSALRFSNQGIGYWSKYRYYNIYRILKRVRPQLVYEFGSGISTVLISEVLRENEREFGIKGKVVSFEQCPQYFGLLDGNFPDELRKYAEINLAQVNLDWFGEYRGIYYDVPSFPSQVDLVYIDGATRTRGNEESDFVYPRLNADIVRMHQSGTRIRLGFTDHRYACFPFYQEQLGVAYDVSLSKMWCSIIIRNRIHT